MTNFQHLVSGRPRLAVLIDPDKSQGFSFDVLLGHLARGHGDIILLGGSTTKADNIAQVVRRLRQHCQQPIYLFPGNHLQICEEADGILLLSLLSGRNPEYLIQRQVENALMIKRSGLEVVSTAYLLIDGGKSTAVHYITQTIPIPRDQSEIALATATAAELMGFGVVYLEAGSGAHLRVPSEMITMINKHTSLPVIVGGGMKTIDHIADAIIAGAKVIVIGNVLESKPELLPVMADYVSAISESIAVHDFQA